MDDEDGMEIDPAIAAAMGFSGFGTKPGDKRKHNSNEGYVDPAISSQVHKNESSPSKTHKAMKMPIKTVEEPETEEPQGAVNRFPAEATLEELKNGVRNEKGNMVYFMPSFLEDPWKDVKPK